MVHTTRRLEALRYSRLEICATTLSTALRPCKHRRKFCCPIHGNSTTFIK